MTLENQEGLDQLSRATFLRQLVAGSGAAVGLAAVAMQTGCRSVAKSVVEGAGEGADEWADNHPETKRQVKLIVEDTAAITSRSRATAQELEEAARRLNDMLKRNERNIDRALEGAGALGDMIRQVNQVLQGLRAIFDKYANSADDLFNALVYFLRSLALKVGAALAELIAYFLYLLFLREIDRLIEELKRRYWSFNFLGAII